MEYYSAMKKLSQKSFNVIEIKDTIFNEISQKQKDHVLLTICGHLKRSWSECRRGIYRN